MIWEHEREELISQIKQMGRYFAPQTHMKNQLESDVERVVQEINQWNERDVRVNMDEYCVEADYNPENGILYPTLINRLNLENGQKLLEIGVGFGYFSLMHARPFDYYGIDKSLFAVFVAKEQAKRIGINPERIIYAPDGESHFNEKFDAGFCVSVLHETEDAQNILSNMAANVRAGGRVASVERLTDILETPEHYIRLLREEREVPFILQQLGLKVQTEDFSASYSGCNFNKKYKFSLVVGQK